MLGLYTNRDVQKLVRRLREEYDEVIKQQREAVAQIKEQNRVLLARVSQLETERRSVSDALIHAVEEGERIKQECALETQNERNELALLMEKCRTLSEKQGGENGAEDEEAYSEFLHRMHEAIGENAGAQPFDMDEVLSPKEPLNLEQLCMDLGLMEEENE